LEEIMSFPKILFRKFLPVTLLSCAAGFWLVVVLQGSAALAQDSAVAQQAAPILTIIITRHGVRSYSPPDGANDTCDKAEAVNKDAAADEPDDADADNNSPPAKYRWADWNLGSGPIKFLA
jgi:hypothetical protein